MLKNSKVRPITCRFNRCLTAVGNTVFLKNRTVTVEQPTRTLFLLEHRSCLVCRIHFGFPFKYSSFNPRPNTVGVHVLWKNYNTVFVCACCGRDCDGRLNIRHVFGREKHTRFPFVRKGKRKNQWNLKVIPRSTTRACLTQERPDKRSPRAFPKTVSIILYACTRIVVTGWKTGYGQLNGILYLREGLKNLKKEYPREKPDASLDLSTRLFPIRSRAKLPVAFYGGRG